MVDRLRLGCTLGIPMRILESIEIEVSQRPSRKLRKKVALERMMNYWFEKDKKASLEKLAASLHTMELNEEEPAPCCTCTSIVNDQVRQCRQIFRCGQDEQNGQYKQGVAEAIKMLIWNAAVEESDISKVVNAIGGSCKEKKSKDLADLLKVKGTTLKAILKLGLVARK